jgi:hypothetical protein
MWVLVVGKSRFCIRSYTTIFFFAFQLGDHLTAGRAGSSVIENLFLPKAYCSYIANDDTQRVHVCMYVAS